VIQKLTKVTVTRKNDTLSKS